MLKLADTIIPRGEIQIYRVLPDGGRELAYEDHNQIQYVGAHRIAMALASGSVAMPILDRIVASDQDPIVARSRANPLTPGFNGDSGVRDNKADPSFEVTASTPDNVSSFEAVESQNLNEAQIVVARGIVARESENIDNFSLRFYQFGLIMTDRHQTVPRDYILAYKYIPGGIAWGIANGLDVIWTLYLGS